MKYTDAPARRDEVLRLLAAEHYVSSARVAAELGVSEMTIRRDLQQLEADGLAVRVVGGARFVAVEAGVPFDERDRVRAAAKLGIARAASEFLLGNSVIGIDAGTTLAPLADLVSAGTTIVTHSAPVLSAAWARNDVDLIALGGVYQPDTRSFAGPATEKALAGLVLDIAVLAATAVNAAGLMCANPFDAQVKQGLANAANATLLLVDSSKLGASAPIRFATLDQVSTIITDSGASEAQLDMLRSKASRVIVAP